jgi:hypothetical protein
MLAWKGSRCSAGTGSARHAERRLCDDLVPVAWNIDGKKAGRSKDGLIDAGCHESKAFGLVVAGKFIGLVVRVH